MDRMVAELSQMIIDDYPHTDPRWTVRKESIYQSKDRPSIQQEQSGTEERPIPVKVNLVARSWLSHI